MAFSNSLAAISAGATLVDGTMAGHGRGSGNAKTEELAAEIDTYSPALFANLFNLGEHLEQFEYSPGDASGENSFAFHFGAKLGLHPNLVMNIFEANPTLGLGEVLTILDQSASMVLQDEDLVSLIRQSPKGSTSSAAQPIKFDLQGKKFFLFARGNSLESDYSDVEHFLGVNGVATGFLNGVPNGMRADLLFAIHPFRRGLVARRFGNSSSIERVCAFSKPADDKSEGE
jgi:4-hydroxy 2-oxovalerate aldolase